MALFKQMTAPSGVPREGGLDALKLLLAISVVGIHGNFLRDVSPVLSAVLVDGLFRIAVPTFFLIGGVFFARMTDHQIARWLRRLLGLYVIWMLAYSGYWLDLDPLAIRRMVRTLLVGHHHLWFLPALITAVAVLCALRRLPTRRLLAIAGCAYLMGLALQYAGAYHLFADPAIDRRLQMTWVYRNGLFVGLPFLTFGYLMARHEQAIRLSHAALSRLLFAGVMLLLAEALLNHAHAPGAGSFDLLLMLPFVCPLIVLRARRILVTADIRMVAQVSTGIYLIHPLILDRIRALTDWPETPQVALTVALSAVVSYHGLILLKFIARSEAAVRDRRVSLPPVLLPGQDASR